MKEEKVEEVKHKKEVLIISENPCRVFEATRLLEKEFPNIFVEVISPTSKHTKRSPFRYETETNSPVQTITTIKLDPSIVAPEGIYNLVKNSISALKEANIL